MSHVVTVDLEIKDLDALAEACTRLGLELVRGQQAYRWFGRSVGDYPLPVGFAVEDLGKCEHAIRIPGDTKAYEVGVVPRRDGRPGYTLVWDFFKGGYGLEAKVGENCNKLRQAYGIATATRQARKQGFQVQEVKLANGAVQLRCRK